MRKKFGFFKKWNNIRRVVLFRAGSYGWKKSIFRRKLFKFFGKYNTKKTKNIHKNYKFDLYNSKLIKRNSYHVKATYKKKPKRVKKPLNIKFKFNRTFYNNRKIFQSFFGYSNLRQFKFNNKFSQLFKKSYYKIINTFEFNVVNLLIKSRFVFTTSQAKQLISKNHVYINGSNNISAFTTVSLNSRIQLIISRNYYYYFKRLLSNIQALKKQTGYRVWRLTRFMFNFYKQSAKNIPSWVDSLMYYKLDVPKFLEVDYTTLTSIILYQPNPIYEGNYYTAKYINFFLIRLYNWKYVV